MRDDGSPLSRSLDEPGDEESTGRMRFPRPRLRRRESGVQSGDRESLMRLVRDIPAFLRLLGRLYRDSRVSTVDKGLVLATIGYIVMPMDLIPDFIPFLGQIDDLFLLALALNRLLGNAGIDVLLDHWEGRPATLEVTLATLERAGALLPEQIREVLRRRVG
jgi:uncharacterized membrane protein YkvA (DUF1232 family)